MPNTFFRTLKLVEFAKPDLKLLVKEYLAKNDCTSRDTLIQKMHFGVMGKLMNIVAMIRFIFGSINHLLLLELQGTAKKL